MRSLIGALAAEVAQVVPTEVDGSTYGTLLALELNKMTTDRAALNTILIEKLSPTEFMFLRQIRTVQLVSLQTPNERRARIFSHETKASLTVPRHPSQTVLTLEITQMQRTTTIQHTTVTTTQR